MDFIFGCFMKFYENFPFLSIHYMHVYFLFFCDQEEAPEKRETILAELAIWEGYLEKVCNFDLMCDQKQNDRVLTTF